MAGKEGRQLLIGVVVAFAGVAMLDRACATGGFIGNAASLLIPLMWIYLPVYILSRANEPPAELGLTRLGLRASLLFGLKVCAVILPLFALGFWIYQSMFFGKSVSIHLAAGMIPVAIWNLVGISIPEEIFFRGFVQGRLDRIIKKRINLPGTDVGVSVILAAAVFALAHVITTPNPARLAVFFPGLVFGWAYERSRNIAAPALIHWLSNMALLVLSGKL